MSPQQTLRVHQCISGFTQAENRVHGVFKLAERLHDAGHNNCTSRVSLRPWNADWSEVAESIWLLGQHHNTEVVVNVYAYSWGAGWGFVRLAEELKRRDVSVNAAVLSDAVYRHPRLAMRWTSLLHRDSTFAPVIRVPSNVASVYPLHQTQNTPQGHKVVGGPDFSGYIAPSVRVRADHQYMDDAPQFHNFALAVAAQLKDATK